MQFAKFASSLLTAAALLSTSVTASPTKSPAILARDANSDLLDARCAEAGNSGVFRRSLTRRFDGDFVDMNDNVKAGPLETEMHTFGMATCQGIAVSGEYEDDDNEGNAVFLTHIGAGKAGLVDDLVGMVKEAQGNGLENIRITVVYLNPDTINPEDQYYAARSLLGQLNTDMLAKVNSIEGADVTEEVLDATETASLNINDDGEIAFEKHTI